MTEPSLQPLPQPGYVYDDQENARTIVVRSLHALELKDGTIPLIYVSFEVVAGGLKASDMYRGCTSLLLSEDEFMKWDIVTTQDGEIDHNPKPCRVFLRKANPEELAKLEGR